MALKTVIKEISDANILLLVEYNDATMKVVKSEVSDWNGNDKLDKFADQLDDLVESLGCTYE